MKDVFDWFYKHPLLKNPVKSWENQKHISSTVKTFIAQCDRALNKPFLAFSKR